MYVDKAMRAPVVTVTADTTLAAAAILAERGFRHLPVVDGEGRLAGMVTDRDLRSARPSGLFADPEERAREQQRFDTAPVSMVMTRAVHLLPVGATLDDALLQFDRTKVGALPVVDEQGQVAGILTLRDLLGAYRRLFGLGARGSALVAVAGDGSPDFLSRLLTSLERNGVVCTRLVREDAGGGPVYLRVHTYDVAGLRRRLREAGFTCLDLAPAPLPRTVR